jgi:integrative and conjugative element protein (TIGR02256 family)
VSGSSPPTLDFRSKDGRFALSLASDHVRDLLLHCAQAGARETGGVLLGHYTDAFHCAVVTLVCGPEDDSRAGATWFERGTKRLRTLFHEYWHHGKGYYLGEWHFHPANAPTPSGTDLQSMRRIGKDPAAQCRQPVLLIVGGLAEGFWTASANVFPDGVLTVELHRHSPEPPPPARVKGRGLPT